MSSLADSAASFLLNAAWQTAAVAAVAALASRLLARAPARQRHLLWLAALAACVALPLSSLATRRGAMTQPTTFVTSDAPRSQANASAATSGPPGAAAAADDGPAVERLMRRRSQTVPAGATLSRSLAAAFALILLCRLAWLARAWRRASRLRRTAYARELTAPMRSAVGRCRASFGLRRTIEIVCSPRASAPVTVGALRPAIILPESFYDDELSEETLASVLGHELAHVARRDYALNLACELLLLPVCFHPLARLVKRRIERERELACDELVAGRVLPADAYARALVRVAGSLAPREPAAVSLGIFDADILEERIMRLTRKPPRTTARAARLFAASAAMLLCLSCLSLSIFSFELRPGDAAAATPRASADAPGGATTGPRFGDAAQQKGAPARAGSDGGEAPRPDLAQPLASPDAQTRAQAACDAGRSRSLELIPALVALLGDDAHVRPISCWGRGRWSPALSTFKSPSPGEQAAIALASMGAPSFKHLAGALDDSDAVVRRNAAWAVGELTDMTPASRGSAVPRLVALLGDADEWVRMAAARSLGELQDERAAAPLTALLSDGEWRVRELAAWALGEMRHRGAVERLCAALSSDARDEVRATAAWALGEIHDRRAVASLRQALGDPEPRVREKARWALSEIEGDDDEDDDEEP